MQDSNFSLLRVKRVIFHDVPSNPRSKATAPVLSEVDTTLDPARVDHLKSSLTRTLQASSAYDIRFGAAEPSKVPQLVTDYLGKRSNAAEFVEMTQELAKYLHKEQTGQSSSGLLTILECVSDGRPCIVLMKLEREAGAQLEPKVQPGGKKTFEMSVMNNLVLTDGTKLFKCAMFVLQTSGVVEGIASDDQRSQGYGDVMAAFWRRFLGAEYVQVPRIATKQFFDATMDYLNEHVTDLQDKNQIYEHLVSELTSQKATFAPQKFIDDYVPDQYGDDLRSHLQEVKAPLKQFKVDTVEIKSKIKRRAYRTENGAVISAPESIEVQVSADSVTVHDTVRRLG